jgi:hypothetical protein
MPPEVFSIEENFVFQKRNVLFYLHNEKEKQSLGFLDKKLK